jgi:hypothetical protein
MENSLRLEAIFLLAALPVKKGYGVPRVSFSFSGKLLSLCCSFSVTSSVFFLLMLLFDGTCWPGCWLFNESFFSLEVFLSPSLC